MNTFKLVRFVIGSCIRDGFNETKTEQEVNNLKEDNDASDNESSSEVDENGSLSISSHNEAELRKLIEENEKTFFKNKVEELKLDKKLKEIDKIQNELYEKNRYFSNVREKIEYFNLITIIVVGIFLCYWFK
ncbi:hypothetical protein HERIO_2276 [Hepatospora eriocheir]|uniref:Uncharacterized protein n=1 Tax=Hepatospora eriocheir TaxID=1081669 RepID=A0A1X0Q7K1_9MICR|nr:hypothetical protein HERIO_2276 [Hepatospora eriocheir]